MSAIVVSMQKSRRRGMDMKRGGDQRFRLLVVSTKHSPEPPCFGLGQSFRQASEDLRGEPDYTERGSQERSVLSALSTYGSSRQGAVLVAEPELPAVEAMVPMFHGARRLPCMALRFKVRDRRDTPMT